MRQSIVQFINKCFVLWRLCVFTTLLLFILPITGQAVPNGPLPDAVFNTTIKTVQFYKQGWEFSLPIIDLNDPKPLLFSFDDLDTNSKFYSYVIVMCDADWMPSRLSPMEYLDGFYQNQITSYESSQGTHVPYIHYSLQVPNENIKVKLAGNYVLLVYDKDEDHPILIKRFVAVEKLVDIFADVRRPTLVSYQDKFQEVDFTVSYPLFPLDDPYQSIKVVIVKNNIWKFSNSELKPLFVRNNELIYNYEDKNLFPGGNEFRAFDTKTMKYNEGNVKHISFNGESYQIMLLPDEARYRKPYLYSDDLNGRYLIQNLQGNNAAIDAEYVHVHFSFRMDAPLADGDIYVWGGLSDYNCYDDFKMKFNPETMAYELDALVKQGYYNYQYVYQPHNTSETDDTYFEGNHYETENSYVIYVYYRPFGARYDRLLSVKAFNSLKRQ